MDGIPQNHQGLMSKRIRVVWICHFSDEKTRAQIQFRKSLLKRLKAWVKHTKPLPWKDSAVWNSNAIREFEQYDDIDLTVIFPHQGIQGKCQRFSLNGVKFVCFRSQDDSVIQHRWSKWTGKKEWEFKKNRRFIAAAIKTINPDIVHVIGAENPYYALAALDIPESIPSIVSLQTLMSAPGFFENFHNSRDIYEHRAGIEREIIRKCDYIFSGSAPIQQYVRNHIKPGAVICNLPLAVGVDVDTECGEKEFDFVYFASNINKAGDVAIEAFALALKKHPQLRLNVSGGFDETYKMALDKRIRQLGIEENVFFSGAKATHEEVLKQIKKSKFAVLPLKVDMISSTIREAMACGLPVVTTVTPATPELNKDRESVLLSKPGDLSAMAEQMVKLAEDGALAEKIRANALVTVEEKYSNKSMMEKWRRAYHEIMEHHAHRKPLSPDILAD